MELPHKVCPECRVEYVHEAVECSDCGVALVAPEALGSAGSGLPEASELAMLRAERGGWIQRLADALHAEGIPHRIQSAPAPAGAGGAPVFAVFVRTEDLLRAREVDAAVLHAQLPELGELGAEPTSEEHCPACGHELASDAAECPDCGLSFGEPA